MARRLSSSPTGPATTSGRPTSDTSGGLVHPEDRARDDHALDLARPLVDLRDLRVAGAFLLLVVQAVATDWCSVDPDVVRAGRVGAELLPVVRHTQVTGVEGGRAKTARAGSGCVGSREDEERPGVAPVRDPLLRA